MIDASVSASRMTLIGLVAVAVTGCPSSRKTPPPKAPAPTVRVGECADPSRDGTLSPQPELRRADRDLDLDGTPEVVVADEGLCQGGNCHWNLFAAAGTDPACHRFLGTVAGASIEVGEVGEAGFPELRGWWTFDEQRALLQVYQFRGSGYLLMEALLCRQRGGDGVRCVSER